MGIDYATRLAVALLMAIPGVMLSGCDHHLGGTPQRPAQAAEDFIKRQSEDTLHSGKEAGILAQYVWALDKALSVPKSQRAEATKVAYQASACVGQTVDYKYQRRLLPQVEEMLTGDADRKEAYLAYVKATSSMPAQSPYLDACNGNTPRF